MVASGRKGFAVPHTAIVVSRMEIEWSAVDAAWGVARSIHPILQRGPAFTGYRDSVPLLASTLVVQALSHVYSPPSSTCLTHSASVLVLSSYLLRMLHLMKRVALPLPGLDFLVLNGGDRGSPTPLGDYMWVLRLIHRVVMIRG